MNAITVKNLTKKFKEATVLDNINVDFEYTYDSATES